MTIDKRKHKEYTPSSVVGLIGRFYRRISIKQGTKTMEKIKSLVDQVVKLGSLAILVTGFTMGVSAYFDDRIIAFSIALLLGMLLAEKASK